MEHAMEQAMVTGSGVLGALPSGEPLVLMAGTYGIAGGFELHTPMLRVQPGRMHALVGPNGAGKTSLLRLLSGDHEAGRGRIFFDGARRRALHGFSQSHVVGAVSHAPASWSLGLFDRLCLDAVMVGASSGMAEELASRWIEHLGLQEVAGCTWGAMSAGFRMRAAIARQMVQGPPVLLLDEPLGPLDLATQRRVLSDLQAIARLEPHGVAVVLSSQHLAEVEQVADDLVIVERGQVTYAGPRAEFGRSFGTAVFELSVSGPNAELLSCLEQSGGTVLRSDASGVRVEFSTGTTSVDVMRRLVEANIAVQHMRELTNSSARLL